MTLADFELSLTHDRPPLEAGAALAALWWLKKGNWDRAHEIVMNEDSGDAAWVHAHLHRIEGDQSNAQYWYRQARQPMTRVSLDREWKAIAEALLRR
jgi:hypothetical protein